MQNRPALFGTPQRVITLDGASNFRDIGGYPAATGRTVAWRRIYRADSLDQLSEADLEVLTQLDLRTVHDLRHHAERERLPDRLPEGASLRAIDLDYNPTSVFPGLAEGEIEATAIHSGYVGLYRQFPIVYAPVVRALIADILEIDRVPLVIHCASGKDRTGFAIAIILLALGVSREVVAKDFMLSNDNPRKLEGRFRNLAPDALHVMQTVHQDYIQSMFQEIDDKWGSDELFLLEMIGIDEIVRKRLIEIMTDS
jgi:protein-tyrosine phosphatase